MQEITAKPPLSDDKQSAILMAAFDAFSKYGYRRTSMEDIAKGAGMSRAALYLYYRNKEDIFRSLAEMFYEQTATQTEQVLGQALAPEDALKTTFMAQARQVAEMLLGSPHGEELMDTKTTVLRDVIELGEARMAAVYAQWLKCEANAGRVDLACFGDDADSVATTMIAALHGQKADQPSPEVYLARVERLSELFGRALKPS